MYDAIIFDLDGTLIDSERVSFEEFQKMCATFGKDFSAADYSNMMGRSGADNDLTFREQIGVSVSDELMADVRKRIKQRLIADEEAALKPGAREFLQALSAAGYRLAVATASSAAYRETVLTKFGIRDFFESVVSGEEVAMPKPAPDIYLAAAKALDVDPTKCLAVEDAIAGVRSGCAAGMDVLGIRDKFFFEDLPGARRVIDSFAEIAVEDIAVLSTS